MDKEPWYKTYFDEAYFKVYAPVLSLEKTNWEVTCIEKYLKLPAGSTILDLCCGQGRHALLLAQHGYRVTGQDLSASLLNHARAQAERQNLAINWLHEDMRHIPFENEFDAVINLFNSFGYLEERDDDIQVLRQIHKALKPGGRLLIELISRDGLLKNYLPYGVEHLDDGTLITEERHFDVATSRSNTRITIVKPQGQRLYYQHSVRIYTLTEMLHLLQETQFQVESRSGNLDGSPFHLNSMRQVILAVKN